ncbi:hypothetical protein V2J09_008636 [Rumex salicifolius]
MEELGFQLLLYSMLLLGSTEREKLGWKNLSGKQFKDLQVDSQEGPPILATQLCILAFQHYIVMLGTAVSIANTSVPSMGGTNGDKARVIQLLLFIGGMNTLLQRWFGTRLPTVMGPSYAFIIPELLRIYFGGLAQASQKICTDLSEIPLPICVACHQDAEVAMISLRPAAAAAEEGVGEEASEQAEEEGCSHEIGDDVG